MNKSKPKANKKNTSTSECNSFVSFKDVVKSYKSGMTYVHALNGLSFDIEEGEFVVIVGPSGAGKTTLLNLLGGMDNPTSGEILMRFNTKIPDPKSKNKERGTKETISEAQPLHNADLPSPVESINSIHEYKDISKYNERQLTEYRRNDIGFVFQFYNLMPNLTALENVELAVEICKEPLDPDTVLTDVGLQERKKNFPSQLSGGEQQRVSIARSIAKNSRLILCDEPTGALDYETGKKILKLLHTICKEKKKKVVLVTHNSALKEMADKVIQVKNGRAEEITINKNPKPIEDIEW